MDVLSLTEAGIAAWLAIFARVAGWAMLDPLLARLPMSLRLMIAAVLAAALLPSVAAISTVSLLVRTMQSILLKIIASWFSRQTMWCLQLLVLVLLAILVTAVPRIRPT